MNRFAIYLGITILMFLISFFIAKISAANTAVPIETFFIVNILDSKTGNFVGQPAYLKVESYDNRIFTYTITHSPQKIKFFVIPIPEEIKDVKLPYRFTAYREGYKESEPYVFTVTYETPKTGILFEHTFYLDPIEPTVVHVNVKNKMDQPIKDASINVTAIYANETHLGKTDEKGIFSFSTRFENFMVYVSAKGYKPFESELKVLHNVTEMSYDVVLEYLSFARYTIEVKDEAWNPIEKAKVTLTSEQESFTKISDEKGLAKFEISTAKYNLKVEKEGYKIVEMVLDLSKPVVGGRVVQLTKLLPWYQEYWYVIAGIVIVCATIPLFLKVRKKI